jgi:UDP-N-acetylmuramoyl-tripeptide--D-alanyl-D-alanine ligase
MTGAPGWLWTAPELAAAVGGRLSGRFPEGVSGVSIDTRTLEPGDLFVALTGPNRDAHDFVGAALEQGAAASLVARLPPGLDPGAPLLLARDTQAALERLGAAARARSDARIVAVTGSVGKTGTKEMLALALSEQGPRHWSRGSYNNLWGVPLSLARMPRQTAWGVFEIGMNHAGEITPLTRLVRPHVAIVTTVEPVHLEFFASVEAIADAKAEIFAGLEPAGTAILNRDNPMFDRLAAAARAAGAQSIVGFGRDEHAGARLVSLRADPSGSDVVAEIGGLPIEYRLGQPGRHLVMNSLAVLAAVEALGADLARAAASLARFEGIAGRGRQTRIRVRGGTATLIDESYNASPASVRAALAVLGETTPAGRRIAVLGDMRELGDAAADLHRALADSVLESGVELLFLCGESMRHLAAALPPAVVAAHASAAADLAKPVAAALAPGDVVMVKGSLGSRMADVVGPLLDGAADGAVSC